MSCIQDWRVDAGLLGKASQENGQADARSPPVPPSLLELSHSSSEPTPPPFLERPSQLGAELAAPTNWSFYLQPVACLSRARRVRTGSVWRICSTQLDYKLHIYCETNPLPARRERTWSAPQAARLSQGRWRLG